MSDVMYDTEHSTNVDVRTGNGEESEHAGTRRPWRHEDRSLFPNVDLMKGWTCDRTLGLSLDAQGVSECYVDFGTVIAAI